MESGLGSLLKDISTDIQLLGIAGVAGALVKAVADPEKSWRRRIAQVVTGIACALFLGNIAVNLLLPFVSQKEYAWLAAGFLSAYSGEAIVSLILNRAMGTKK